MRHSKKFESTSSSSRSPTAELVVNLSYHDQFNMPSLGNDSEKLSSTVQSTLKLLTTFENSLNSQNTPPSNPPSFEPLDVLSTAATLIHAHTTKLVLLLTNQPFTPSAICSILRELSTSALPAMMAAMDSIDSRIWTKNGAKEIRSRVRRLLNELMSLIGEIPRQHERVPQPESSADTKSERPSKDSLVSTGVIWECCESIQQLKSLNLAGIVAQKAEEWKATLQDALNELKEWSEDVDTDDNDEDERENSEDDNDLENTLENVFDSQRLPKGEAELRIQLDQTLKKLRLIDTLYAAVIKRRLKTIPPATTNTTSEPSSNIENLDKVLVILGTIPEHVDELIGEYYELHSKEALKLQDKCISLAISVVKEAKLDWAGKEDVFTAWSGKWLDAICRTNGI